MDQAKFQSILHPRSESIGYCDYYVLYRDIIHVYQHMSNLKIQGAIEYATYKGLIYQHGKTMYTNMIDRPSYYIYGYIYDEEAYLSHKIKGSIVTFSTKKYDIKDDLDTNIRTLYYKNISSYTRTNIFVIRDGEKTVTFYRNGNIKSIEYCKCDAISQIKACYHEDGSIKKLFRSLNLYDEFKKHLHLVKDLGEEYHIKSWHDNKQPKRMTTINGNITEWYKNGQIRSCSNIVEDTRYMWYENGLRRSFSYIKNGYRCIKYWYANGNLKQASKTSTYDYIDTKCRSYYENGMLKHTQGTKYCTKLYDIKNEITYEQHKHYTAWYNKKHHVICYMETGINTILDLDYFKASLHRPIIIESELDKLSITAWSAYDNRQKKIINYINKDDALHRGDGPALIEWYENGNIKSKLYSLHDSLYREDESLPVLTEYFEDQSIKTITYKQRDGNTVTTSSHKTYFKNRKLEEYHDGNIFKKWDESGTLIEQHYIFGEYVEYYTYKDGISTTWVSLAKYIGAAPCNFVSIDDRPSIIKMKNNIIIYKCYHEDFKVHRDIEAALEIYDDNGDLVHKGYYIKGKLIKTEDIILNEIKATKLS